ncbi:MAG TPA: hypothetical protein VHN17_08770 [Steroidobacteraceae bacterium]|nr:hypothetical protein [Steroidobacteraceae bacterium]
MPPLDELELLDEELLLLEDELLDEPELLELPEDELLDELELLELLELVGEELPESVLEDPWPHPARTAASSTLPMSAIAESLEPARAQ